ncbi:hypothetical protein ACIBI9_53500 [Nonomuraea sp. NPDC050451]|uniref:hypothetical protein n=1 Tax=Nonomuraea sp. NPDC050451 TaxID=3364364 RepID=UPI0037B5C0F7
MDRPQTPTAAAPEISDFDVWRDGEILRGKHRVSSRTIEADTVRRLELLASAVRIGTDIARVIP